MRSAVLLFAIALAVAPAAEQAAKPMSVTPAASAEQLPPISYVCPMSQDADVIEDKPGKCPKCGMTLEPVRLDSVWTCPVHAVVRKDRPGKCPIDGRDLIQVTMSVAWSCKRTDIKSIGPGTCPDGSPMRKNYMPRPHGNHNPQHGGQFFMAADNWHHLEGTYPRAGVFHMYLYDDYTKTLPRDQVRKVTAQVVLEQADPNTHVTKPIQSFPLVPVQNGRYFEAKVGRTSLPATIQARLKFQSDAPEHVFDFSFDKYSKESTTAATMTSLAPTSAPPSAPAAPTSTPVVATPATAPSAPEFGSDAAPIPSGVYPALIPLPIPDTVPEMLAQLRARTEQIKGLIDKGAFGEIYVPAFQAKDLALALEVHQDQLPAENRRIAEPAITRLVRSAYLLDAFGDIGNKQQIAAAYVQFAEAARNIQSAFPR